MNRLQKNEFHMKVDRSKLKKSSSEVPADCKVIIDTIKGLSQDALLKELKDIKTWSFGKCELYHWADVLDIFDSILEKACYRESDKKWTLLCDLTGNEQLKQLMLEVLRFTALLIEHSFSRHLYNSMDHLTTLLTSCDMSAVLYVLNLLYVFSKRSNFISRMSPEKKQGLIQRLVHLAESWGGKENGFGLAECCQDLPKETYPPSATTLHFEFYAENKDDKNKKTQQVSSNVIQSIHMENVDKTGLMPSQIMEEIMASYDVPVEKQIVLFTHVRLACLFSNYDARVYCVQARLQAISILVYSIAIQDNMNVILYPGLIEELVDIVEIKAPALVDIKSAALRTLTSVIHIERNPRLTSIIDATGASSYHGFLPVLVRTCIQHMIDPALKPFPQTYATSLFSFLYHLASYENGVEALVSCGMMESLLKVINWYGDGQEHITFVTRAVRVIDLITNMDMAAFQGLGGLQAFINRLEHEVNLCRIEQPFEILPNCGDGSMESSASPMDMSSSQTSGQELGEWQGIETNEMVVRVSAVPDESTMPSISNEKDATPTGASDKKNKHCFAQRAALLKSMLNFMKKAIPDMSFAESIRHLMDGSLPKSLKHIISNAEYYGPSLFLLATDVVTVYVFQEPSLLSSLQDKGLTDVVLHALLVKDVPATREVLASLPNVFSALCLNTRGLEAFVACRPFDRLFKVLLSPDYLPAMRRRRSSDPFGDTASNLGNAMDELMRHQPSLRTDATKAIIKLLEEICSMGQDPHFICQKQQPKTDTTTAQSSVRSPQSNEASSSDEEDEEEVEMPHMPPSITATTHLSVSQTKTSTSQESMQANERQAIPLMDYVLNVMKFVEAILSNNSTDDHCREFVVHKGLKPLMSILGLPNLPIDFPSSQACQAVSSVCKSVLTLSREPQVLKQGLLQMNEVLHRLQPLHQPLEAPGGSVLLRELANCAHISDATLSSTATPLLHSLAAAHAYIMMFVHVCRMGQTDIRTISVNHWGSDLGLEVLKGLSSLYNSLVWESTVLLALCNEDYLPPDCQFGRADLEKLLTKDAREKSESGDGENAEDKSSVNDQGSRSDLSLAQQQASQNMETLSAGEECMDISETGSVAQPEATATSTSSSVSERLDTQSTSVEGAANRGEGTQSLNLPFTGVTTSVSSASIDSDNMGATGPSGTLTDKDAKKKVSPAMQAQLRQLKPLLTLSSRLGRALSELFVLLVKLSVGSPVRQRRSQPAPTPTVPSPAARDVAFALTKLLGGGLSFKPPAYSPQPKLRMTFLVCSAGFTAPMLFDEKKQPYHLMLQKFVACGGQAALFQSFSWALSMDGRVPLSEGLEHPDLPEGTGEFLDSWLNLVEKMINPKTVLESPHTLPPKAKALGLTPFNAVRYLMSTQKAAFNAVMNLWNKTPLTIHGGRISESVLAILCHIICGETVLKIRLLDQKCLEKEKAAAASGTGDSAVDLSGAGPSNHLGGPSANLGPLTSFLLAGGGGGSGGGGRNSGSNSAGGSGTVTPSMGAMGSSYFPRNQPDHLSSYVHLGHLTQLMDMGFTREQAFVALHNTSSIEQATEYILTHPIPTSSENQAGGSGSMDVEMDEEGQIMKAIAMSLGENAIMSTDQAEKEKKTVAETEEKQEDEEPLDSSVLDEFTTNILPGCLKLLDTLPETVYRVCDLFSVVMYRNGAEWKSDTLARICADICEYCKEMTSYAEENNLNKMLESANAQKLATRLHLLSLLAEEMNQCVAVAMHEVNLPSILTTLLVASKNALLLNSDQSMEKSKLTPKWLAPLLLLLDMWEKIAVAIKRKIKARIIVGNNRIWKWFDDSSGRWCKYSTSNNNTIDEAYRKGESFVRFQAGRRKYSVQFGSMIQLNEETGNRRPVMLSVPTAEEKPAGKKDLAKDVSQSEELAEEIRKEFDIDNFLPGFTPEVVDVIISALSAYLSIPLTPDCLHATMRLILRLTREHHCAEQFVCEGGAQRLLSLTAESNFQGFLNLATLIFRHILEEPVSLRYCMEKVMRNVCAGMGSCRSGVSQGGVGSKEMHYILRVLGPAACRNPELFARVARDTLQITLLPSAGRDEDDSRYTGPNAPQFLKCTPTKQLESLVNPWIKNFIWDLLNALIMSSKESSTCKTKICGKPSDEVTDILQDLVSEYQSQPTQGISQAWTSTTNMSTADKDGAVNAAKESTPGSDEGNNLSSKLLIPKSAILRLLSEIIRSYGNCVQLITQHIYQPGQSDLITDSCSVLAFVLDNLLSSCQNIGDKDCPALSRVFIASIASCSLSPDAQMALVTEVKGALQRALALPEGSSKHQRVQALSSIINTMIESCQPPGHMPSQFFKGQQVINNNMMKILVKKGMLADLARIPHNLDLSSPFLAVTVNSILKPLETLSRSVNSPDKFVAITKRGDQSTAPDQGGTTTQVVSEPTTGQENNDNETNEANATSGAQMNVTIEDVTNDLEAQSNLEVSTDHQIVEPESFGSERAALDDVLSQILNTNSGTDPESQVLSEMTISQVAEPTTTDDDHEILIDVEVEGDEDDYENGHHDSQMVSQVLSDEEDDADDGDNDRDPDNQDDVSGDDEDYDEADQEEMGDDEDEEDEEEDEDEEDEETSDMDGEGDGDGFRDMRNPFDTDDVIFHMQDFPPINPRRQTILPNQFLDMNDYAAANDAMPSLPPAPSLITNSHPLLMRQQDNNASRAYRSGRSRLRPLPTAHVNMNSTSRPTNTPVILQRLLGPSTAAEILQLTSTLSGQNSGGTAPTRVVVAGENLPFLQRPEDDSFIDEIFQDSDDGSSGSGILSCIPSTLTRWTEETKVLDADGLHDLITMLKPALIEELVRKRDEELEERREKRKKNAEMSAEETKKKEKTETTAAEGSGAEMESKGESATGEANQAAEMLASAIVEQVLSPMVSSSQSESVTTSTTTTTAPSSMASSGAVTAPSFHSFLDQRIQSFLDQRAPPVSFTSSLLSQPAPMPSPDQPMTVITQLPPSSSTLISPPSTTSQLTSWNVGLPLSSSANMPAPSEPGFNNPTDMDVIWGGSRADALGTATSASTIFSRPSLRDNITASGQQQSQQNSIISQLLDSIIIPSTTQSVPSSTSASSQSVFVTPTSSTADPVMAHEQNIPPAMPAMNQIPVSSQGPAGQGNPRNICWSFMQQLGFAVTQTTSSSTATTAVNSQAGQTSAVTTAGTNPGLIQLPMDTSSSVGRFDNLDPSQDLDFSMLFSPQRLPYSSSGVTGATPPLSNLSFGSATSQPISTGDMVELTPDSAPAEAVGAGSGSSGDAGPAGSALLSRQINVRPAESATDPEIPEGVDPSFLAALPEHIRQEVISEQLRLQRIRRRAEEQAQASVTMSNTTSGESSNVMEVNPEFLAALPPAIQEEVLAQQRAEQARVVAQQQSTTNPDLPVDPATFFSTLPSSLRQQVLSDMDDSMLAVLPPELLTEAQELRRNMEERHRRRLQEPSIIGFLRDCGLASRLGTRFAIRAAQRQSGPLPFSTGSTGANSQSKIKGRFMLDPEALTCLLVLLFIDDPKLNTARLHKVFRNLCYHGPTRAWLIRALISIVQKAGDTGGAAASMLCTEEKGSAKDKGKGKKSSSSSLVATPTTSSSTSFALSTTSLEASSTAPMQMDSSLQGAATTPTSTSSQQRPSSSGFWLSISLEAALGCRANVFQIQRAPGKKQNSALAMVNIHPQAAPVVCRHTLDTLISLAKIFPSHFLPVGKAKEVNKCEGKKDEENEVPKKLSSQQSNPQQSRSSEPSTASSSASVPIRDLVKPENDFWNILVRLDNASGKSKGKGVQRSHSMGGSDGENAATDYTSSALGQLMGMLSHPVVRRSQLLTDRLLRLLGLISVSLPDNCRPPSSSSASSSTTTTTTTTTTTSGIANTATTNAVSTTSSVATPTLTSAVSSAPTTANAGVTANLAEEPGEVSKPQEEEADNKLEDIDEGQPILQEELRLAVEVLTSKSCSEEGLEDATNLLLQLSWANPATRAAVLNLLLSGARQLGLLVCGHIQELLEQLSKLNSQLEAEDRNNPPAAAGASEEGGVGSGAAGSSKQIAKGVMVDRFSNGASVVVSAPTSFKTGRELHLPSMSQLTSKSSGQHFFLRILKVIIQLRDAARTAGLDVKVPLLFRTRSVSQEIRFIINSMLNDGSGLPVMPAATGPISTADSARDSSQTSSVSESLQPEESAMEVDAGPGTSKAEDKVAAGQYTLPRLSEQLELDQLWDMLGECLAELARTPDHHAVLILQPAVEAFFIVHAGEKMNKSTDQPASGREDQLAHLYLDMAPPSPATAGSGSSDGASSAVSRDSSGASVAAVSHLPADTQKFLKFAETHRTVLNQILRQSTLPLSEGPFSVLVDHMRILDFDVKRRYFRQELERLNEGARREDLPVHVRRSNVFEDSFRELFRRSPEEWKQRFYIVFEGEEGQDAGGLLREWYIIISHEIFNQNYALFRTSPGDRVTYTISPSSHCNSNHLSYFKFVGRIIAKAVYDNKLLDCYFTRSFYKHMLGLAVKYTDMESEDYAFYQGLHFLLENTVADMGYDLYFSTEVQEFGVTETRELMPGGSNILVNEDNKREYVKWVCQMKMTGAIRQQLNAFLEGFYDIIPKKLVSIFTEQELELLISGLPTIDIDDLKGNTEYIKYQATSLQIQWFWRALRSFDQAERANFLQFVTGTSKVPLGGFANLEGMNGTQKFQIHRDDRSTDRLPSAHTCFNQLDLPAYETYDKLRKMLLMAVSECSEGFGLA